MNMFVMELVGCDMVLGMQWLQFLGIVTWDFKKLTMNFSMLGQVVTLKGLISSQPLEEGSCTN